ncbi:1976_t:CDS:10 [Ambispora gerdemannii]|uniref:1976_t:CDS:1 n=1 Tax=Ambispora gerdemannii TaxID=144530 RepID=A0A9N8YMV6_9GLOM|nr:1976_t:CDS:10 [Ambispora gerdemannii]
MLQACLLIAVVQYAFANQNYTIAQHTLAELSTIYFPPPSSQPPQTYHIFPITNRHLHLHYSLLFIAYHMHTGNMKFALEKLSEVHKLLDERREEDLDELKGYITIYISAAPTSSSSNSFQSTSTSTNTLPVSIRWLSKAEIYTLTFLISGICNRGDTANVRSSIFLTEGLKIVEKEIESNDNHLELQDVIQTKRNYVQLKAYMLLHLADVHLLKSEFDDAERVLSTLINWTTTHSIWQHFEASIVLALGLLNQSVGKEELHRSNNTLLTNISNAFLLKDLYQQRTNKSGENKSRANCTWKHVDKQPGSPHTGSYINEIYVIVTQAETIINEIRQELVIENSNVDSLKSAFRLLEALASNEIVRTREHLFESLKLSATLCNDQLKTIALAVLGTLFYHTQNEQAEKMLKTAYVLSKSAHNDLWCLVAGFLLKEIYGSQGNQQKYSKQFMANQPHEHAVFTILNNWSTSEKLALRNLDGGGVGGHGGSNALE